MIDIDGVDDPALVGVIAETIRASFRERVLPGAWRILVRPSPVSRRWDLKVYGADVSHALSIAVPAPLLPDLIPKRLRESLDRLCPDRVDAVDVRNDSSLSDALVGSR